MVKLEPALPLKSPFSMTCEMVSTSPSATSVKFNEETSQAFSMTGTTKVPDTLPIPSTSRRWKKTRSNAISKVTRNDAVDVDMGAAATSCAAWWIEEQGGLTAELISQRNARFAARLRGSLADLLNSRVDDAEASECTLLVPVHQAWLPSLEAAVMAWPDLEQVSMEA